jgi:DNA modification methylase
MPKDYLNKIVNGNCLKIIPYLPNNNLDLVVCSPPYNTGHKYDVYKDNKPHKKYIAWLESIFRALYPKMKKGGRICVDIGDGCNGRVHTHVDVAEFMTNKLRYLHMSTIVWNKENSSIRTAWGSFKSPQEPSFPTSFEYVLIFAKGSYALQEKGETDLTTEEFVDWSLALWKFDKTDYKESSFLIKNKIHYAPFPEELPTRLIKMLSWVGATVLDPFSGVGTTALACKKLGRNYIGIELSKDYCKYAEDRLKYCVIQHPLF